MATKRPPLSGLLSFGLLWVFFVLTGTAMLFIGPNTSDRLNGVVMLACAAQVTLTLFLLFPPDPPRLAPTATVVPGSPTLPRLLRVAAGVQVVAAAAAWWSYSVAVAQGTERGTFSFAFMGPVMTMIAVLLVTAVLRGAGQHLLRVEGDDLVHENARRADRADLREVRTVERVPGPPPGIELKSATGHWVKKLNPGSFHAPADDLVAWLEHRIPHTP